jgi:hypothetical protein
MNENGTIRMYERNRGWPKAKYINTGNGAEEHE